jgi:hypothetical protein
MRQFIPANLDIDKLLAANPPSFKYHRDNFVHILHLLTEIPARNKDLRREDGFVPIHAHTLQKQIRDYNLYLEYLVNTEVLDIDSQYIPGIKSREYRFTEQYQSVNKVEQIDKFTLTKNISKGFERNWCTEKQYPFLSRFFTDDLKIDHSGATDYLFQLYKKNCSAGVANSIRKYNYSMLSIEKLKNHEFFFHVDKTVNRLHTNLTGCKSQIRNFITYSGMDLVSIDLKNSQPWISTILLDPKFYENWGRPPYSSSFISNNSSSLFKYNNYTPFLFSSSSSSSHNNSPISLIMIVKNELSLDTIEKDDVKLYKSKVLDGTLYDYFSQEIFNRHGMIFKDRKAVKAVIFTVLFSDNRFIGQKEAYSKRLFREIFPNVYEIFKILKRSNASDLPVLLQRMESSLILNHIAYRISKEQSGLPIFTIHDSVVFPVGYENYVTQVIKEESMRCLGSNPTLAIEPWSSSSLKLTA